MTEPPAEKKAILEKYGGEYIAMDIPKSENGHHCINWQQLLANLKEKGLRSVMVVGGGHIINSLLLPEHQPNIDMAIVTIAPTWLGQGDVVVSPNRCFDENEKAIPAARLSGAKWYPFGEDVVLRGAVKL